MKKTITVLFTIITFSISAQIPTDSLSVWLRSDIGVVTSGSDVTQWNDQSGNGRNAISSTNQPQLINNEICGYPVVRFNTTGGLTIPSIQTFPNKRGTIFMIVKYNNGGGGGSYGTFLCSNAVLTGGVSWQYGENPINYTWWDAIGCCGIPITNAATSNWGMLCVNRNQDISFDFYKSGALSATHSINDNQPTFNDLLIGQNSGENLDGDIAEILIYNKSLSAAEMYLVNSYLGNKYCFNVIIPSPLASNVSNCGPSSITLTASGGIHYRWYNDVNSSVVLDTNAIYTTPVLTATDTFYVANYNDTLESPRTMVIATINPVPALPTISAIGSDLMSSYTLGNQWYLNGNILIGETNQFYTPTQNGLYSVSFTDDNNCTSVSTDFNFLTNGINNYDFTNVAIYPNPFNSQTTISFAEVQKNTTIKILNVFGEEIKTIVMNGTKNLLLEKNEMSKGVYIIKIMIGNKNIINRKIVVE